MYCKSDFTVLSPSTPSPHPHHHPKGKQKKHFRNKENEVKRFHEQGRGTFPMKKITETNVDIFESRMSLKNDSIEALVFSVQFLFV